MEPDPDKDKAKAQDSVPPASGGGAPQYMTVGSGSTSATASALIAQLDRDSGYGGSIADAASSGGALPPWHPSNTHDIGTPSSQAGTPAATAGGVSTSAIEHDRRVLNSHIHQLHYNQNRTALARAISRTVDVLKDLQRMNAEWPAHYPSLRQPEERPGSRPGSRPGLQHAQTSAGGVQQQQAQQAATAEDVPAATDRPPMLRRADTAVGGGADASGSTSEAVAAPEQAAPSLITPQGARDFSILKLDLKLQGLTQSEIAHSMDRRTVASLLDGRINQSVRHLLALRERIEDTSSKVLVTGDLNAGKSTFCNALLRRKVLPEDQQPCTSIFCEVLDARANAGVEEVHAVRRDAKLPYDRNDERTYDVFALAKLEAIVVDSDTYAQCKVYVRDIRSIDESLLNNGVVDISIIDAPGLNADSLQTTAVFARQEEIDVVVFVVSAANHFTLSAKEFIWNAAHEKAYIFIVVNGYDNIRDKQRCQRMVLDQVANLSPRTFKESSELVHFVSSNQIPLNPVVPGGGPGPNGGGSGGSGSGSGPSNDPSHDDEDDSNIIKKDGSPGPHSHKGKGKEKENLDDFADLEGALRRFVLEKRARSKLAPARTYLINVLSDMHYLAETNQRIAQEELERVRRELAELIPQHERSERARNEVSDEIDRTIDSTVDEIYASVRSDLAAAIASVADADLGVEYPGLIGAFGYAEEVKSAILARVSACVTACEDEARGKATGGVRAIAGLGKKHLGDAQPDVAFRSDLMFRRRRDALARQVSPAVEVWDFFDVSGAFERQEKVAGGGMALTVVGVLGGRMIGGVGWMDGALGAARLVGSQNMRRMIVPGLVAGVCLAAAYMLHSIPHTLPRRLSRRIAEGLAEADYTHANSARIAAEVGKVLRFPANNLRLGLQKTAEGLREQRESKTKSQGESDVARKYFANLVRDTAEGRRAVEAVDLEGSAPAGGPMTLEESAVL